MKRKILFLISMALCLGSTYAQGQEKLDDQKQNEKAIQSLEKDLEERDKTIGEL